MKDHYKLHEEIMSMKNDFINAVWKKAREYEHVVTDEEFTSIINSVIIDIAADFVGNERRTRELYLLAETSRLLEGDDANLDV